MRFIGIEDRFGRRVFVRIPAVGYAPLRNRMRFIGKGQMYRGRVLVRAFAVGSPRLGDARKLIGIRRSFGARATFGAPDVSKHPPPDVPMPPVPREYACEVQPRVTEQPCGSQMLDPAAVGTYALELRFGNAGLGRRYRKDLLLNSRAASA